MKRQSIKLDSAPKGKKASFFDNPEIDYLFSIITMLTQELSVTYDRIETLELILEKNGLINKGEIDNWVSNESEELIRSKRREDLISRIFNVIHEEAELTKK
tara:strand:- start:202 stop:507 length:306 start_codon:yes stop_codon:yes gene_type:complete